MWGFQLHLHLVPEEFDLVFSRFHARTGVELCVFL